MALDPTPYIVGGLILVMAVIMYLELRYLRKSARARRARGASRSDLLPDEAHNALSTTRAILAALERTGLRSDEATALMDEARVAYERRNYRVAIDLTKKARDRLMALKSAESAKGDLVKLEAAPSGDAADEATTKERLQKEYPGNLAPAKFALGVAEGSLEEARSSGRDVRQAETLLLQAKDRFEAQDYDGALSRARLAQRAAEGRAVERAPPVPAPVAPKAVPLSEIQCSECGAPLNGGDAFCRKCGAKIAPLACPTCGADLLPDDLFCRKCGTRIHR